MNKNRHSKSTVDTKPPKHTHTHTQQRQMNGLILTKVDQSTVPLALTSPCDKAVLVNTRVFYFRNARRTHKAPTHTFHASTSLFLL